MDSLGILRSSLSAVEALKSSLRKVRTFFSSDNINKYYEFKEVIGSGFFATVYRGIEISSGQEVAIKSIDKTKADERHFHMMEEEVQILQTVRHSHCVSMIEIFDSPKHLHLVMELITGGELFDHIIAQKRFVEEEAKRMMREICLGLEYLHKLGIVHRDLKPQNILLEKPGPTPTLKITDFGLSKVIRGKGKFLHSRCGTPAYAAPELIRGRPYGPKVDTWAAGVILYILLSGNVPFSGDDNRELFDRITSGDYYIGGKVWKGVSSDAKDLVRKLLVVDPEKRFSTTEALNHPWLLQSPNSPLHTNELESLSGINTVVTTARESKAAFESTAEAPNPYVKADGSTDGGYLSENETGKAETSESETTGNRSSVDTRSSLDGSGRRSLESRGSVDESTALAVPVNDAEYERVFDKYPLWPAFGPEFTSGNLLGGRKDVVVGLLQANTKWKRRALEEGFLRPYLLLLSMHPRQRLSYAKLMQLDLCGMVWYGNPHMEAWEIISHSIHGIQARTNAGPFRNPTWWDAIMTVTNATLNHFWSQDRELKPFIQAIPFPPQGVENIREHLDKEGTTIRQVEEMFTNVSLKKLYLLKQRNMKQGRNKISYHSVEEMEAEQGPDRDLIARALKTVVKKEAVLKCVNWYLDKGYADTSDNEIFMGWVEKERKLTLSSVFLNKLSARVMFPVVFSICVQRVFLCMSGIYIENYWPEDYAETMARVEKTESSWHLRSRSTSTGASLAPK